MSKLAEQLSRIVQLNPGYFAFASGVAVSLATNLLTGLATVNNHSCYDFRTWVASIFALAAGLLFILVAWKLEEPHVRWKTASRDLGWTETDIRRISMSSDAVSDRVYLLRVCLIWSLMIIGIVFLVLSLLSMFI